ncbi:GPN-loop GTPase 2-like [Pollicipes pollicipes]|uniref:GPN-loop GTPase 2-like n=1 Tax=Pollicipes pollicipes TaxID=41117 RepID=UPI0018855CEA|nr:GPN-loop GTPase 2-like [Pollicipes pollicipes]
MAAPVRFGQAVVGPPGSGKSTYCGGMQEFLRAAGRQVAVVNLDPANDALPFAADVDLAELVTVADVMQTLALGPNGALLYCMEYLEKNVDWLLKKLRPLHDKYILFDFPGQVELYTHNAAVPRLLRRLERENLRLTAVNLVDSHYCSDPGKFVSVLLTTLSTMLHLELPHINVLSKIDLAEKFGKLHFGLDFYTEVMDLERLTELLDDDPFTKKYRRLTERITGLVQDYGLVSFAPLNVADKHTMHRLVRLIDKANGYVFGAGEERSIQSLLACAVGAEFQDDVVGAAAERYLDADREDMEP